MFYFYPNNVDLLQLNCTTTFKKILLFKILTMKKIILLLSFLILISGCGVKQTRTLLTTGNYDEAINTAISNLRSNKDKKSKQDYIYLIEEAFAKAKDRDLNTINLLQKDKNPVVLEKIYNTYLQLNQRQENIKPLLPLKLMKEGRNAKFPFSSYNTEITESKKALSDYLYSNSKALLLTSDKLNARKAFEDLTYLDQINPNYKNVVQLLNEAKSKGLDYVSVLTKNETNQIIPTNLLNDLLDFNTYNLNNKWTVYHNQPQKGVRYDYGIVINFKQINISPEQIKQKEINKEKSIKDGVKTLLDSKGKVVNDSLGNPVKVDNLKTIRIKIYEFSQFKSCQMTVETDYVDYRTNQLIKSFPLASEFIFENRYATYKGDKRACEDTYYSTFEKRAIPFPSNEQMVYDTGEDLKAKLKDIIKRNQI